MTGKSFEIAQQIICGENCTFVIHSNGAASACGEGSNGRLGLGNSDDYDTLTLISALRGTFVPARDTEGKVIDVGCQSESTLEIGLQEKDIASKLFFLNGGNLIIALFLKSQLMSKSFSNTAVDCYDCSLQVTKNLKIIGGCGSRVVWGGR